MTERAGRRVGVALLAVLAYVPALLSSRGVMPADTKLYLYLDPGRLITDAPYTFDGRQFAGWVPHQVIAYLWPQGPWYWLGDQLGLPDWIVHRLWIGTLLLLGGWGVMWCARRLGLGLVAALTAGLVYQLTPYVLPYVSRTSAMLLPWAGLGWIIGLTVLAARRGGWRDPAVLALVVASVGAVNATALLMVAPAPILWLVVATATGEVNWRRALVTAAKVGGLCLAVSAWWIGAVIGQGRHGADVLSFSETLRAVSRTATAPEVWRAMGYWLGYIADHVSATTTASLAYVADRPVMLLSFAVPLLGVAGLTFARFTARRYAIVLVVTGLVLGVGVHPIDDPTPLMDLLVQDTEGGAALALRSSTRAIPVLVLGLGLGLGALVGALLARVRPGTTARRVWTLTTLGAVVVLLLAAMPALRNRQLVDPSLSRQQDVPEAWQQAADALDELPDGYRVWQLPGLEFGAFRWGVTVDPPLPGLTDRPVVTRDLLPLGSGPAMDLLWALDNRFQDGVAERAAVAPVARLFGVDRIWLMGDAAFERYRTPRPELMASFFEQAGVGLGAPTGYGPPTINASAVPVIDETAVTDDRVGDAVRPVALVPIEDPVPIVRAKDDVVLLAGTGDGVVDAAAAGLIDGTELIRYTGSLTALDDADRSAAVAGASEFIVTDSGRDRALNWAGSQDTTGFTESADVPGRDLLDPIGEDVRFDVFGPAAFPTSSDAYQDGPVSARATGYGHPFTLQPEDRPVMAIDGDPTTAWRVADRADATGARLELTTVAGIDHVTMLQPVGAASVRHLGQVRLTVGDDTSTVFDEVIALDASSLDGSGQRIDVGPTAGPTVVTITVVDVAVPDPRPGPATAAVGLAEVDLGLGPTTEVVRVANDLAGELSGTVAAQSLDTSYVFTRLRTDPLNRWRSDPEPELIREWDLLAPTTIESPWTVQVRLDARATDQVLAAALGVTGALSDGRAAGAPEAAGWAAGDGEVSTAWITPFAGAVGRQLTAELAAPTTTLRLTQLEGAFSPISAVRVEAGGLDVTAPVVIGPDGIGTVELGAEVPAGPFRLTITGITARQTLDRRFGEPVELPAALAEIDGVVATAMPRRVSVPCRDDLLQVDGQPLPVSFEATTASLLAGDPVTATICGDAPVLPSGPHRLATSARGTGWLVDRVVIESAVPIDEDDSDNNGAGDVAAVNASTPTATITDQSRLGRTVTVSDCPNGCWLVLGEGYHPAWSATTEDGSLGPPELVDGGFNGWWIEPSTTDVVVTLRWTAQGPLNVALAVTIVGVLACLTLIVISRRRERAASLLAVATSPPTIGPPGGTGSHWAFPGRTLGRRRRLVTIVVWAAATAVLVSPAYGVLAVIAGTVLVGVIGRPRLVGVLSLGLLLVVVAAYNWAFLHLAPVGPYDVPARYERLHLLALFAGVSLLVLAVAGDDEATT